MKHTVIRKSHAREVKIKDLHRDEFASLACSLLDCTLPKNKWTHAAHLAATLYFLREYPDIDLHRDLPGIIKRYNNATGTPNTDSSGYHATLTHFFITAISDFNNTLPDNISTIDACKKLLFSPLGDKNYPLKFYSKEKLFSVEARRNWVLPDLRDISFENANN